MSAFSTSLREGQQAGYSEGDKSGGNVGMNTTLGGMLGLQQQGLFGSGTLGFGVPMGGGVNPAANFRPQMGYGAGFPTGGMMMPNLAAMPLGAGGGYMHPQQMSQQQMPGQQPGFPQNQQHPLPPQQQQQQQQAQPPQQHQQQHQQQQQQQPAEPPLSREPTGRQPDPLPPAHHFVVPHGIDGAPIGVGAESPGDGLTALERVAARSMSPAPPRLTSPAPPPRDGGPGAEQDHASPAQAVAQNVRSPSSFEGMVLEDSRWQHADLKERLRRLRAERRAEEEDLAAVCHQISVIQGSWHKDARKHAEATAKIQEQLKLLHHDHSPNSTALRAKLAKVQQGIQAAKESILEKQRVLCRRTDALRTQIAAKRATEREMLDDLRRLGTLASLAHEHTPSPGPVSPYLAQPAV
eukprot:TRINITY_DN6756_c1_g1_i2.p1 TRINITY_DN6756_c1_g1~~TRINITY_DN6756_c1_g1_i2.p1  ORF type:complete len:424 (+),score=154.11 TRINITY_DN6756_c1_g1_i2:50-1273(+)